MAQVSRIQRALVVLGLVGLVGTFSTTTASAFHFGGGGGGHMSMPHFGGGGGGFHPSFAHVGGGGGFRPSLSHVGGRPSFTHFGGNRGSFSHPGHISHVSHVPHDGGRFSRAAEHHGPKGGDRWTHGSHWPRVGSHCGHWNHWCGGGDGGDYTPLNDETPIPNNSYVAPTYSGSESGPSYSGHGDPSYSAPQTKAPESAPAKTCTADGTFVTVVFQPNVTAAAITAFLKDYDVTMADGPNADGMYRIRISQETGSPDQFGEMIESMRSKKDVISSINS